MSTATPVPETWQLTGDDARETLLHLGRRNLIRDAFQRLRSADGFSHARSLAFTWSGRQWQFEAPAGDRWNVWND